MPNPSLDASPAELSFAPADEADEADEAGAAPVLVRLTPSPAMGCQVLDGVRYDIIGGVLAVPAAAVAACEAAGAVRIADPA